MRAAFHLQAQQAELSEQLAAVQAELAVRLLGEPSLLHVAKLSCAE